MHDDIDTMTANVGVIVIVQLAHLNVLSLFDKHKPCFLGSYCKAWFTVSTLALKQTYSEASVLVIYAFC